MKSLPYLSRWIWAAVIIMAVAGLFVVGIHRLQFDTDILNALPQDDPVMADGRYVFLHHPIQDQVVVDVGQDEGNPDRLCDAAELIEKRMRESGLFREVGFQSMAQLFPELLFHVVGHLPALFDEEVLEEAVRPLLAPEKVKEILEGHLASFGNLEGIGQASLISSDPLGLRNLVLSRLSDLAPAKGAAIYKGHLLSQDRKHLLVMAEPRGSGMDTRLAQGITDLMERISQEVQEKYGPEGALILTPVGAYRAALDNETNAKKNVRRAVVFSTIAIAILLLVCFPRPLIGLLSLLPAFAGTMTALFVYSLFHSSISLMAIGFGGAIISFTVDYGLTYLLFLDRPYETRGMEATKEVWNLGFLAMLTTAGSFAFLSFSGFPALAEIGSFASLGVVFTYIFVHLVFPLVFPVLPPAQRPPLLPLQGMVNKLASSSSPWKAGAALAFGVVMLFFAKPDFQVNPAAMNAVSPETIQAEQLVRKVWGDIFSRVYLLVEGKTPRDLQDKCDRLALMLDREVKEQNLSRVFVPSMIFPGEELTRRNLAAWERFWNPDRIEDLKRNVAEASVPLGFSSAAFVPFFSLIQEKDVGHVNIPERFFRMLGISSNSDRSAWFLVATLTPGPAYDGETFFRKFSGPGRARVFDPTLFGERLGSILSSAFLRMAAIVGAVTVLIALLVLFDWKLALIGLLPTLFAMICTLGTLNLMGEPLGIPMVMVSVVVIGMGTDYALYLVRSGQRYIRDDHPSLGLVRLSVFLSFSTTFIGVAVLALSDNALLKNAGLGLSLGIGYSFLGAVMIAPPLLKRVLAPITFPEEKLVAGSRKHLSRVLGRYRHMEGYPRLFARFKILMDPMFPRLADFLRSPQTIIDIGTGFGVAAAWLLELHPQARLYAIDPDRKRVSIASRVIGSRGNVQVGRAPDIPGFPGQADTALLIDVIHQITDEELRLTLMRLREKLTPDGTIIIRVTAPSENAFPWKRWMEKTRIRMTQGDSRFRTEKEVRGILSASGFHVILAEPSAPGWEETWLIARAGQRDEKKG
jgi:predicted exporter